MKAIEQRDMMLRLCGWGLYISIRECDALLLLGDEMNGAEVNLNKEKQRYLHVKGDWADERECFALM